MGSNRNNLVNGLLGLNVATNLVHIGFENSNAATLTNDAGLVHSESNLDTNNTREQNIEVNNGPAGVRRTNSAPTN